MKKIINGKVYDTETAHEVGSYSNAGGWGDFHHYEETMYRKRTGEYFLFGEGGAMTRYAKQIEMNSWSGGSRIMPMTFEEARQWCEDNLDAGEYEAEFGEVAEDESKVVVCITIRADAAELAKRRAAEAGTSVSAWIESLIK